ncbi:MAG TPA: hypothetical protein VES65_04275 [Solirubrobacteraceae bacterium]|nr:hypothetical protein [Solirubrobacteraceae bacterium]
MGKRSRRRATQDGGRPDKLAAPTSDYTNAKGNVLTLRGALTAATRREYAEALAGNPLSREDAWQRAVELLFERLTARWTIAGAPLEGQRELLQRYRAASPDERFWIRDVLREHCSEHFPELRAP